MKKEEISNYIANQPDDFKNRVNKEESLLEKEIDYPYKFEVTGNANRIRINNSKLALAERTTEEVSLAGRIMGIRQMGNVTFLDLQDSSGKIQLYVSKKTVGQEKYIILKNLVDYGDIIGISGTIFKTRMGELSVDVDSYQILAKTLRPMPEKFHGLTDVELRYRQRYLDLIVNPEVRETFVRKTHIYNIIRNLLNERGFLEVETPVLQPIYGGASAKPFKTYYNFLKSDVYLRIADELYLKRCIIGGLERVFEFSKDFRNESIDSTHNPEFTQLEIYQAYADYNDMMELIETLVKTVVDKVYGTSTIAYGNYQLDLSSPWKQISMKDAVKDIGNVDIDSLSDRDLENRLNEIGIKEIPGGFSRGRALNLLFEELVENKLIQPTIVKDYPIEISPLARKHRTKEGYVERFEVFIAGKEVANAYSELNDPLDQRYRFLEQQKMRTLGDEEAHPIDEDFLTAMEYGMPPTGGLGIGMERLVALLTNKESIKEVILFPAMKAINDGQE